MLKKILLSGVGFLCLTNAARAGDQSFYGQLSTGVSFSKKANISNVDYAIWDPANEGYKSRLGNVLFFGLGLGYNINLWSSLLASWDWKGIYNYRKHQTQIVNSDSINPLGKKTRYFDIENNNLMFTLIINGSQLNNIHIDFNNGLILAPFIGAGLGVAENDLTGFYSLVSATEEQHRSYMHRKTSYSLAAQGIAGFSLSLNKTIGFDLGYRFYYGGKFKTNTVIMDPLYTDIITPPWKGSLFTNELFLNIKYTF